MSRRFDAFLFDKKYRWIGHLLFWAFIYIDELLSLVGITPPFENPYQVIPFILLDAALVYFNLYVLIPKFLLKRKYVTYIVLTLLVIIIDVLISSLSYFDFSCGDCPFLPYFFEVFIVNASMFGLAIALKLIKVYYKESIEMQQLKSLQHETELSYLKNQINPHFLFNALNSIYVMAQKKVDELPEAVLNLSDLLRYQTYDANKKRIALREEIKFIHQFFEFAKIRRNNLDIVQKTSGDVHSLQIAPLLLLPLAENALKYSISSDDSPTQVQSLIEVNEKAFVYFISNTIGDKEIINKDAYGGLGLTNLRRRLQLIYPDTHILDVQGDEKYFEVRLEIQIDTLKNG